MIIQGRAITYGDHVNTDVIIPGKYLHYTKPEELAAHAMAGVDPDFLEKARDNAIIVAGRNFGCGSSREQAVLCLRAAGVNALIASSFARIFYRNAINQGLPVIESAEAAAFIDEDDQIEINLKTGVLINQTQNKTMNYPSFPPCIQEILSAGGLLPYLNRRHQWDTAHK